MLRQTEAVRFVAAEEMSAAVATEGMSSVATEAFVRRGDLCRNTLLN